MGHYLQVAGIRITLANLVVIAVTLLCVAITLRWNRPRRPVYGLMALAALTIIIISGVILLVGGLEWWRHSGIGTVVNSIHLWATQVMFATTFVHAVVTWRRAVHHHPGWWLWATGMVIAVAAIVAAFTGYVLLNNFTGQWVIAEASRSLRAIGVGTWFTISDNTAMLWWHCLIIMVPILVVGAIHIARRGKRVHSSQRLAWRRYYLGHIALRISAVTGMLVAVLAVVFPPPNEPAVSLQHWAQAAPGDTCAVAGKALSGQTSEGEADAGLVLAGVRLAPRTAGTAAALETWHAADRAQREQWAMNYYRITALGYRNAGTVVAAGGCDVSDNAYGGIDIGPVPLLAGTFAKQAAAGKITDPRAQRLVGQGMYLADMARRRGLEDDQWGMANESGNHVGQPWLIPFAAIYQIPAVNSAANPDAWAWGIMAVLTVLVAILPWLWRRLSKRRPGNLDAGGEQR